MSEVEIVVSPVKASVADNADREALAIYEKSKIVSINSQGEYDSCAEDLKRVKSKYSEIEKYRKSITGPLDDAKSKIMDLFRKPLELLSTSERMIKEQMSVYEIKQKRIQEEAEKKAREDAAKEEAKLRKIKEDQEREWREKEAAAKAEEKRLADEIAKAKTQKEKIELELASARAKLEAKKAAEKAEERAEQAREVYVPAPEVKPTFTQAKGVSSRTDWEFEIINEDLIPREWLIPDLKAIGGAVSSTAGKISIPGIKCKPKQVISSRKA